MDHQNQRRDGYRDRQNDYPDRDQYRQGDPRSNRQPFGGRSDQDDYYDRGLSRRNSYDSSTSDRDDYRASSRQGWGRPEAERGSGSRRFDQQGSDYDYDRRHGAGLGNSQAGRSNYGPYGAYGMGRASYDGDIDRGYDQSGYRGGLGSSGGREPLNDRRMYQDRNAFRGGYDQGDYDRPVDQSRPDQRNSRREFGYGNDYSGSVYDDSSRNRTNRDFYDGPNDDRRRDEYRGYEDDRGRRRQR